jgi:dihydrodipicolinate synthase/N-acetylneuraminate lyase
LPEHILCASTNQGLEAQLVQELASHPTVEYIKTLEADIKRYQHALQVLSMTEE